MKPKITALGCFGIPRTRAEPHMKPKITALGCFGVPRTRAEPQEH
jgi:hypothetical protein